MEEKKIYWGPICPADFDDEIIKQSELDEYEDETGIKLSRLEQTEIASCRRFVDRSLCIRECLERRIANITQHSSSVYLGKESDYTHFTNTVQTAFQQGDEFTQNQLKVTLYYLEGCQIDRYVLVKNGESTTLFR
jgi:hypothetical protein